MTEGGCEVIEGVYIHFLLSSLRKNKPSDLSSNTPFKSLGDVLLAEGERARQ